MLGEALEVLLLLLELLLELNELLLLALADGVVLVGLLSSLEGVTVGQRLGSIDVLVMRIDANPSAAGGRKGTYPGPPVLGGAPVAPSVMTRGVVEKHRTGRKVAVWRKVVRSMVVDMSCERLG